MRRPGRDATRDNIKRAMLQVCPTDIIHASTDLVWHLVINPSELARWTDTHLLDAPQRDAQAGDRLLLGAGIGHRFHVVFHVKEVVPLRRVALDIRLPFGVENHEVVEIAPTSANTCRVTFR